MNTNTRAKTTQLAHLQQAGKHRGLLDRCPHHRRCSVWAALVDTVAGSGGSTAVGTVAGSVHSGGGTVDRTIDRTVDRMTVDRTGGLRMLAGVAGDDSTAAAFKNKLNGWFVEASQ